MKYRLIHKNGKEKYIFADNLEEAEKKANKIWKEWTEIILTDVSKGEKVYEE